MTLDSWLLEILACPECKVRVALEEERLVCVQCGRRYRIDNGIPIMLIDEAEPPLPGWQPRAE
jgi:uncharacterized protein YbaR (Trm112 family)